MKTNILKAILDAVFTLIEEFNMYNSQKLDVLSDLAFANVVALAAKEGILLLNFTV